MGIASHSCVLLSVGIAARKARWEKFLLAGDIYFPADCFLLFRPIQVSVAVYAYANTLLGNRWWRDGRGGIFRGEGGQLNLGRRRQEIKVGACEHNIAKQCLVKLHKRMYVFIRLDSRVI